MSGRLRFNHTVLEAGAAFNDLVGEFDVALL